MTPLLALAAKITVSIASVTLVVVLPPLFYWDSVNR
jgi:hypothetical protein